MTPEEQEEQLRLENIRRAQKFQAEAEADAVERQDQAFENEVQEQTQRIRDIGPAVAAVEADPEREKGLPSKVMETASYILGGDWVNETLHSIAPDTFKTTEEMNEAKLETLRRINEGEAGLGESLVFGGLTNTSALFGGAQQGALTPIAIPFVLAGQDTGWNEAPEIVKGSFISKSIYDISKVAAPTLVLGAAGMPMAGVKGLAAESAIEAVGMQDPDDYLFSRTAAKSVGQIVNSMGGDGEEVTRNLLEGNGIGYRVAGLVAGTLHNMAINKATEQLFKPILRKLGGLGKNYDPALDQVAKDSGKTIDETLEIVSDKAEPTFTPTTEPIDTLRADTAVNVIKGDAVEGVSPLGFLYNILGEQGDSLIRRPFFLNVKGFTGNDKGLVQTINILTDHMQRFPVAAKTKARLAIEAAEYISANYNLIKRPTVQFLEDFTSRYTHGLDITKLKDGEVKSINYEMAKNAFIAPQGALIGAVGMRSLNQEAIDIARQIITSDSAGVEWENALPALKDVIEGMETWATIYRQDQQMWHSGGEFKQEDFQNGFLTGKGLSRFFKSATKWADKGTIYGKPEEMFNVAAPHLAESQHFTKLLQQAIDGDKKAKNVVRDIVGLLSMSDSSNPIDISVMTSERMVKAFYEGTSEMIPRVWMSTSILGRLRSAFKALGATALRNASQELSATMGLAGIKLQTDPKSLLKLEAYNDHLALFAGQRMLLMDAMKVSKQAFIQNKPIMEAKTRWKGNLTNLREQADDLMTRYSLTITELERRGELTPQRKTAMTTNLWARLIFMNPASNAVPRALMAQDEGFKVVAGGSYANMLAGRMRLDPKYTDKTDGELFDMALKEIFVDGDPMQGFTLGAGEARDYADFLTMQREITPKLGPTISGEGFRASGMVNAAFRGLEKASEESAIFAWANPFVRMSWEMTSQGGSQLVGAIPGGPMVANWIDPDFRATLRGDYGDGAKLQLTSNLAAGLANGYITAAAAMAGFVVITSFDPKRGEQGTAMKIQMPGMREPLEVSLQNQDPGILTIGMVAAITNEFRDGAISYGDYQTGIFNIFKNFGKGFLDQNVLLGQTNVTQVLDHRNFNEGLATTWGNIIGSLMPFSGPARMASDWVNGKTVPTQIKGKPVDNFWRALAKATGLDIAWKAQRDALTNPWTGEEMTTRAMPEDPDFKDRILSGMYAEAIPFRVTRSTIENPVAKEAHKFGWSLPPGMFRQGDGAVPFENVTQVAQFSKDFHDPNAGDFVGKMKFLFASEKYRTLVKQYEKLRKRNEKDNKVFGVLPAPRTIAEENLISAINNLKTQVVKDAQRDALMKGELAPWYRENKLESEQQKNPFYQEQSSLDGRKDGLYAQALQEDNELANQVRDILDFA